jgi:PTS system fructose-specific IIC component/PTS system nitrogen regulatory IIA component
MLLNEIFVTDRIVVDLESEDKEEVFEELVNSLIISYGINERDDILNSIREREEKMSTGIKAGIALPHGKTDKVKGIYGAIGISKDGIDYDALDGKPVHLIFMLVSSQEDAEQHLRTLKKIAQIIEMPDFYSEFTKSDKPETAFRILKKYEELLEHDNE